MNYIISPELIITLIVKGTLLIVASFRHKLRDDSTPRDALAVIGDDATIHLDPDEKKISIDEFDKKLASLKEDSEKIRLVKQYGQKTSRKK